MTRAGLHHVTAFAGPASRNLAFYTRTLGLRLVKTTVNFDDPGTYHLYYGDAAGTPGTIVTFFPVAAGPGRPGSGETSETAFRVPASALDYWTRRLAAAEIACEPPVEAFGESVLRFKDPDGMSLALVGVGDATGPVWADGGVPAAHAIRGIHGVTLLVKETAPTAAVLTGILGFGETAREGSAIRFDTGASVGHVVTLREAGTSPPGRQGSGSVHHVAFRAADDAAQAEMAAELGRRGLRVTEQRDRCYFRSIYFREPGGVLFEIATDVPGFAIDEAPAHLGASLQLPGFLEAHRDRIEAALPPLRQADPRGYGSSSESQ